MKATNNDIVEITGVLSLLSHIMDDHEMDRLSEVFTEDAVWDSSVFGFPPAVGLDGIVGVLSAEGHALAHYTTNVVVSEGSGDVVQVRSKGLGIREGGTVAGVVFEDELKRTADGWRITRHVLRLK